ncbi:hypothetical protein DSO57_1016058 [Entomophthora muscae]|uniref:Uncharacterized protein n=1 Tax=Entomophthora muscae TaxID=34485 RepID=A0ACC2UQ24_9FUNG|nr:hypothetical protein DSO57_1016058 [Entomophthora muscae]
MKWPLKVSSLVFSYNAGTRNNNFAQILAEEIIIQGIEIEELIIAEPSVFKWVSGTINSISGIKGTRLKHIELTNGVRSMIHFDNVTRIDSLKFNTHLYPTFPNLKYVKHITALYLDMKFDMDIQRVGKLDITISDYLGFQSILLNSLETADDVIITSGIVVLFSAPKLTWGRLEIKHATELNLNENLRWNGSSLINSSDFCEKYFKPFVDRGLAFQTNSRCEVDCKQPYTLASLTLHMFCREFQTIEINQQSVEYIPLYEATTVTGDLIITDYNGTFSAPKLTVITGNVIITNSNNFSFSAPYLKKIQGSITIQNCGSFSAPKLVEISGNFQD